jgi:hypothetical protein
MSLSTKGSFPAYITAKKEDQHRVSELALHELNEDAQRTQNSLIRRLIFSAKIEII